MEIAIIGEPLLRQKSRLVTKDEIKSEKIQDLIERMVETAKQNPEDGTLTVGLAAPQVFQPLRLFLLIKRGTEGGENPEYQVYINPDIEYIGDEVVQFEESCLSTPGLFGMVNRHKKIKMSYFDREGEKKEAEFDDEWAVYAQHELDHLNGVLWVDKVADPRTIRMAGLKT